MNIEEMIVWCKEVTEAFQQQAERRWKLYEVVHHHESEITEFWIEVWKNREGDTNKQKLIDEFWDCIISFLTVLATDELLPITNEEWFEGLKRTIAKVNHRVETEHYKKQRYP